MNENRNSNHKRLSIGQWIKRYPARAAGWAYLPPSAALLGSAAFKYAQGDKISGIFLGLAAFSELAASAALIKYADPEISKQAAEKGFTEIQDASLWQRLTSPKKAPHEFGALMGIASTASLVFSAIAAPTAATVVLATSCVFVLAAQMTAEKAKEDIKRSANPSGVFNRLAERGLHWMQEKPLRAVFWMAVPGNVAQMVDGWQRKDPWMFGSGVAYMAINGLRALSSKRTRILNELV